MRIGLSGATCTGTMADFFNLSCWGTSTTAPNATGAPSADQAGGCYGGSPNLTPAQVAACNAANTQAANDICATNPAACANYKAVTCLNPDGTPTGQCNPLCYLAGLCDTNGNLTSTAWLVMAALGFGLVMAVRR